MKPTVHAGLDRRFRSGLMALLRALLMALSMAHVVACGSPQGKAADPLKAGRPVIRARLVTAVREAIPKRITLQGVVEAERTAAISSRVMASITEVHVQTGDRIRRGQRLLTIDAEAAQGQVGEARGALTQARAALVLAERNHERFQALAATQAASELEVEQARMRYEQARGAVEQGEGALAAALSLAADTDVVAPFAGRVVQRMVAVGDLAAPGRPLLLVESAGARRLSFAVPEQVVAVSGLRLGSTVSVTIDSRPNLGQMSGTVVEMTPGADPRSHAFDAKVSLPPDATASDGIASGVAGRATITTGSRPAVMVPAAAVLRHGGLELVVLAVDGRTSSRAVTTGRETARGQVEILSGLAGGERILFGLQALPAANSVVEEIP